MWFQIILWIIFALVCYKLAKDKGRDRFWAVIMGLLFGIFAVLYYVIAEKKILCPHCRKRISAKAKVCHYCKKELK